MKTKRTDRIVPRETYVLIDPEKEITVSDLIVLPEHVQLKAKPRGKVLAVGPKCGFVRPGDTVWFEKLDWTTVPGTDGHILIEEGEILAKEG